MLTISIVVVYFVVVGGIEGSGFLTNAEVFNRNAAGSGTGSFGNLMKDYSLTMYLTMFFGWGMGLATNPQYLIRIVAAKSCETARKVLIWSRIMEAIRAAPATWELEGPRITGPSTSLKILQGSFSMVCPPFCINHSMFFIHHF